MIDFNQPILDLAGNPLMMEACPMCNRPLEGKEVREMTLRDVVCAALLNPPQGVAITELEKLNRAVVAQRIYGADGPVELKTDDVTLAKNCVKVMWAPLVVLRVVEALDPAEYEKLIE
jgi:hypothetical protein